MKQQIYKSVFTTGPEATKRQQMLFAADTQFAVDEGYGFITDSEGCTFKIINAKNLVEVELTEEELLQEPTETALDPQELIDAANELINLCRSSELEPEDCDAPEFLDNQAAIAEIINNTLNQVEPLRADQINSLLKLAALAGELKELGL